MSGEARNNERRRGGVGLVFGQGLSYKGRVPSGGCPNTVHMHYSVTVS